MGKLPTSLHDRPAPFYTFHRRWTQLETAAGRANLDGASSAGLGMMRQQERVQRAGETKSVCRRLCWDSAAKQGGRVWAGEGQQRATNLNTAEL